MKVAIIMDKKIEYSESPPFSPSEKYPEYIFNDIDRKNPTYHSIRNILKMLGYDGDNYGKTSWNPLGEIIKPGDYVLIKPNLVRHYTSGGEITHLLTHGSIIRAVLDYAYIALEGKGSITIADAPVQDGDFNRIIHLIGLDKIIDFYDDNLDMKVKLIDLRQEKCQKGKYGEIVNSEKLEGDPLGYTAIDLNNDSELNGIINDFQRFRVTQYEKGEMLKHHNREKNEYLISNSVLRADVIINLPKLKSHRKAGMTCSLKNIVGINGSKDWLPHHRMGSREEGGDEYLYPSRRKRLITKLSEKRDNYKNSFTPALVKAISRLINSTRKIYPYKDPYFEGSWYGNDTIPRTISDLNKILYYTDKNGTLTETIQKKMFILVDSIIAGENEGPLKPTPKKCGLIVAGHNPVAVDLVCSRAMGFDYVKIPTFTHILNIKKYRLFELKPKDLDIISERCRTFEDVQKKYNCNFNPSSGWKGRIEYGRMG